MTLRALLDALQTPRPWIWAVVVLFSLLVGRALPLGGYDVNGMRENERRDERQSDSLASLSRRQDTTAAQVQWQGRILEGLAVDACLKATTTEAAWRRLPCQELGVQPRGLR